MKMIFLKIVTETTIYLRMLGENAPPHFGWKCPPNPLENNKKLQIPLKNFFLRIQLNKEILAGICTFFEYLLKICKKNYRYKPIYF